MMSDLVRKSSYDGKFAGLYDLEQTLGRGHFAIVKLAKHVFTGEKVAVKVIDKTKLDEVSRAHLFQEVRCMKLVQHPHVVRLYEVIDTQTKLYLILELGDGGDMYDYIMQHESGLDEDLARTYFQQIVQAISYCHKMHVVHRDLKPENVIFFKNQGVVKLTDFGFSNLYRPGEKLETSCGSLAYSAPEILLGDSYDAPAVDVWSLGVLLYMLVCGEPPFNETNDSETLTMIMDCKYHMPDHISDECKTLIASMLVKDPRRRPTLGQIESDPWLQEADRNHIYIEPFITRKEIGSQLHENIVDQMVKGDVADKQKILKSVEEDSYDHVAATYFLLAERKLKKQYEADDSEKPPQNKHKGTLSKPPQVTPRVSQENNLPKGNQRGKTPASKPVPIPAVMQAVARLESRSPEDALTSGSPRRHLMEREHLTLHPKHGRSLVREGLQSVEETEFQHVAEEEPELFDDAFELEGPIESSSQDNGRGWNRRQSPRTSNPTRLSTSILNQITEEEDEGEESEDEKKDNKYPLHRTIRHRKTVATTENIHLIKTSTKITKQPGGYSSSDASDDDTDSKRRSDRFDQPSKGQRRGSKDGPPGSGGNSGANNGGSSHGGGGMNNDSSGGGGSLGGNKESGGNTGGSGGGGYERKKSNELRESLKMSNLSMTSSRSSSSYSISKYAIDPNNTTPSDSDEQGGDTKTWSDEKKANTQDVNSTLIILAKDPSDVNLDSPSKRKHYSSSCKENNSDLNSNIPRLSRKEQKEIRKKRNRLSNHEEDRDLASPSRNRRVESNCCRLI